MPKYVLDDKGILTITSEHDGGIFTFNDVLKKLTVILLVISIVASVGTYGFFYYDAPTTDTGTIYSLTNILDYKYELEYRFEQVRDKIKDSQAYCSESLEQITNRKNDLMSEIYYQIEMFRYRWR
jgi:hypothetical protein